MIEIPAVDRSPECCTKKFSMRGLGESAEETSDAVKPIARVLMNASLPIGVRSLIMCMGELMPRDRRPVDLARRLAQNKARRESARADTFRRETFALPREAARRKAREMFARYPSAAYMTAIESWRELPGDRIEFTMRRLPSAD